MFHVTTRRLASKHKVFRMTYCANAGSNVGDIDNPKLPPEPTTCCMSGCATCVWIEYAGELAKIFKDGGDKARKVILEKITDPNMKIFLQMELRNIEANKK